MKRLFLENDNKLDLSRVKSYIRDTFNYKDDPEKFFDTILLEATFNPMEAWEAVKSHDEIFAESSLIDMMGVSGGTLFNNMMYHTIEAGLTGKKVYFFSSKEDIWWDNLERDLFEKAFLNNQLFTLESDKELGSQWVEIKSLP